MGVDRCGCKFDMKTSSLGTCCSNCESCDQERSRSSKSSQRCFGSAIDHVVVAQLDRRVGPFRVETVLMNPLSDRDRSSRCGGQLARRLAPLGSHRRCTPFFTKPVSSTIQASIRPCVSIAGTTSSRTLSAETRDGATTDAIGSTLLRSPGISNPVQIILQRSRPVHVAEHLRQTLDILDKTRFARSRLVIHPRRRDPIKRITRISKLSTERIWKNE